MIGTEITITADLAIAVGKLAQENDDAAVHIAYDDQRDEREWYVTLDRGYGTLTYVVDDQTGETRVAGLGERPTR